MPNFLENYIEQAQFNRVYSIVSNKKYIKAYFAQKKKFHHEKEDTFFISPLHSITLFHKKKEVNERG